MSVAAMELTRDIARAPEDYIAERDRRRLQAFTRRMVDGYIGGAHIDRLMSALEAVERGEITRLIVTMPPRHSKSLTVSENFPAWYLGRKPDKRIITVSHTAQLAYTFSRRVRNKIQDPRWVFPDVAIAEDKGAVQAWDIADHAGGYIAVGVGGTPVGLGFDCAVIDDPLRSAADADSATVRDALWEWYQGTFYTRRQPGAAIILTATRWHADDLTGRLMVEAEHGGDQWHHLHMPAINEIGEALWPEYWPISELDKARTVSGSRVWESQYQGRPTPAEGGMFKRHWWRYWQPRNANLPPVAVKQPDGTTRYVHAMEQPAWWERSAQSWDMSFKQTESGSFVVGLVAATYGPDLFLLDRYRERIDFPGTINAVQTMTARYPDVAAKLIEEKANGSAVIDTLKHSIAGLIPVQTDGSKQARAHAATPFVEAGNVYLPHPVLAPWVEEFVAEHAAFPTAARDDQVDAMSQLVRYLMGKGTIGMHDVMNDMIAELN